MPEPVESPALDRMLRALADDGAGQLRRDEEDDPEPMAFGSSVAPGSMFAGEVVTDPFFTARVLRSLPPSLPVTTRSLWRRILVVACFHGLAGLCAYASVWMLAPGELLQWADQAHRWAERAGGGAAGSWVWVSAAAFAAGIALFVPRAHTPAA